MSIGLSIVIIGSLRFNPRLWLQDYPPEIKALVEPITPTEKRQQRMVSVLFLAVPIAVLFFSIMRLHAENNGNPSFLTLFLNIYGVLMIFNLFDLLILDYLLLTIIKPRFAIIPGSEGVDEQSLHLYRFHFVGFLKGCIILAVVSVVVASLVTLL